MKSIRHYGFVFALIFMPILLQAGEDLSGKELSHSNYSGKNLKDANLNGAELVMADFSGADLRGANFTSAKVDRLNIDNADLRGVIGWSKVILGYGLEANGTNFSNSDLSGAEISGGQNGGYFENADFSDTNLKGSLLYGRFQGAKFDRANVEGALFLQALGLSEELKIELQKRGAIAFAEDLERVVKQGREFSGLNLELIKVPGIDLSRWAASETNLHTSDLSGCLLNQANLSRAALHHADAVETKFINANLEASEANGLSAEAADFSGANLKGVEFRQCYFQDAEFTDADLSGADFSYSDLSRANLSGAKLDGVILKGAILKDVRGLSDSEIKKYKRQAQRWRVDFSDSFDQFVTKQSWWVNLLLSSLLIVFCLFRIRSSAKSKTAYRILLGVGVLTILPFFVFLIFSLSGGSPVAQMSGPAHWKIWFTLWSGMMLGTIGIGLIALITSIVLMTQNSKEPTPHLLWALACGFIAIGACFFSLTHLMTIAPDA